MRAKVNGSEGRGGEGIDEEGEGVNKMVTKRFPYSRAERRTIHLWSRAQEQRAAERVLESRKLAGSWLAVSSWQPKPAKSQRKLRRLKLKEIYGLS